VLTADRYKILEFDSASAQTVTFSTARTLSVSTADR
jgi:hypothetical protein